MDIILSDKDICKKICDHILYDSDTDELIMVTELLFGVECNYKNGYNITPNKELYYGAFDKFLVNDIKNYIK